MKNKKILTTSEKILANLRKLNTLTKPGAILESLAYLPKPHIFEMYCQPQILDEYLGKAKEKFVLILKERNLFITDILKNLEAQDDIYITVALLTLARCYQPHVNNVIDISFETKEKIEKSLFQYRFCVCKGAIFEISETLSKALIETDISGKCPTKYLRPPFNHIYIHFGVNHEHTLSLDQGSTYLEGAYISYIEVDKTHSLIQRMSGLGLIDKDIQYAIEITFSLSRKIKENARDTQEYRLLLMIGNENEDVEITLEKHKKIWTDDSSEFLQYFESTIHIAKSLLVINTKKREDFNIEAKNESNKIMQRSLKKYSTKKDMRKELEKYDKILISTNSSEFSSDYKISQQSISAGKKVHWRRGHFRELPISLPNRPKEVLVWVRPALIGAKSQSLLNIEKKEYIAS